MEIPCLSRLDMHYFPLKIQVMQLSKTAWESHTTYADPIRSRITACEVHHFQGKLGRPARVDVAFRSTRGVGANVQGAVSGVAEIHEHALGGDKMSDCGALPRCSGTSSTTSRQQVGCGRLCASSSAARSLIRLRSKYSKPL